MNKVIKKVLFSFLLFTLCLIPVSMIKVNATWGGSSSVNAKTYEQPIEEMRAIWVATVGNLNIAKQLGTDDASIEKWKQNYISILDNAESNNFNTIIFQVRPANDAFYPSKYNPWSDYLVGYGIDPGWDPLAWMIEVTHERGMDYHAWLNPYRVTTFTLSSITENGKIVDVDVETLNTNKYNYFSGLSDKAGDIDNPIKEAKNELLHDVVVGSEGLCILNPASPKVQTHIENTITELVENYNIDGIHFDDYFYPNDTGYAGSNAQYKGYTYSLEPWIDMSDYKAYVETCNNMGTTALSIYNWRRENVNALIENLGTVIRTINQTKERKCAFGISPAARYAPTIEACSSEPQRGVEGGMTGSCYNYYSYSDLYADTYKWAKEEWIDYITPQNYTNLNSDYDDIAKWWSNALEGSQTKLYMGTALYQVKPSWGNGKLEMYYQLLYNDTYVKNISGYFMFSYSSLLDSNGSGAMATVNKVLWKNSALTPTYPHYQYEKKVSSNATIKKVSMQENEVSIKISAVDNAKGYGIFKLNAENQTPVDTSSFDQSSLVCLEINPTNPLEFTKEDGYNYYLVTFDQDNSIYSEFEEINLTNAAPIVEASLDKAEYIYGDTVKINVKITDSDSTNYLMNISYATNGINYSLPICVNEEVNTFEIEKEFTIPETSTTNGKIKVTIIDMWNEVSQELDIKVKSRNPIVTIAKVEDITPNDSILLSFDVSDDGYGRVSYQIYFAKENDEFELVLDGNARNETVEYTQYFVSETKNCQFKVVVSDGENETIAFSNIFNVVENEEPTPDPLPSIDPTPTPSKGCKCQKNSSMFFSLTIAFSLVLIILRKKEH